MNCIYLTSDINFLFFNANFGFNFGMRFWCNIIPYPIIIKKLKMCAKMLRLFFILWVTAGSFANIRLAESYDELAIYLYLDAALKLISDVEHLEVKLSSGWIAADAALEQLIHWQEKFNLDFKERVQEVNRLHLLLNQYIYETQKLIQNYKVQDEDVFLRQNYFDIQEEISREFGVVRSLLSSPLLNKD